MAWRGDIKDKDVRELQRLAQEAPLRDQDRKPKARSRAALLELIDILSRWSAAGLAVVAGVAIFIAVAAGRAYPARAVAWSVMLVCALWVCRRLHSQYRAGAAISGRPFRWRASYTSCLSVLGVVFASAPILLTPAGAPTGLALQVLTLAILGGFCAAALHAAHLASAAAFAAPAVILPFLAATRAGDGVYFLLAGSLAVVGLAVVFTLSWVITRNAGRRNPRTTFLRREVSLADRARAGAKPAGATQNAVS